MIMSMSMEAEKPYENAPIRLCLNSTIFSRVAVAVLGVAILGHLASVGSSYWIAGSVDGVVVWHEGLWQSCYIKPENTWICVSYVMNHHLHIVPGWFKSAQTMAVLSIVTSVPAFMMMLLYTLLPTLGRRKIASLISMGLCVATGIFSITGVIVFSSLYPQLEEHKTQDVHYHWSYAIELTVAILFFAPSFLLFFDMRKSLIWIR